MEDSLFDKLDMVLKTNSHVPLLDNFGLLVPTTIRPFSDTLSALHLYLFSSYVISFWPFPPGQG